MKRLTRDSLLVYVFLFSIYALGVFLRQGVTNYLLEENNRRVPFTLESAFLYRYARLLALDEPIPKVDFKAQHPEGIRVFEELSVGGEFIPVYVYKLFNLKQRFSFHSFIRYFFPFWFCLSIFSVYLVTYVFTEDRFSSILASLLYAVSFAALLRSTGQEFSRENFALPLLFFSFYFFIKFLEKEQLKYALGSGFFLSLGLIFWDMSQLYLYVLVSYIFLKICFSVSALTTLYKYARILFFWLLLAGMTVPYLKAHHFLFSYPMVFLYCLLAVMFIMDSIKLNIWFKNSLLLILVLTASWLVYNFSAYIGDYSHFQELLWAKIKFLNHKPKNPAQIPFMVRLLWTPALNSVSLRNFIDYLGLIPFLACLPVLFLTYKCFKGEIKLKGEVLLFYTLSFLVLFVLFSRLIVYAIFFLSILVGFSVYLLKKFSLKVRVTWFLLIFLIIITDTNRVSASYNMAMLKRIYPFRALKDITNWVRENTPESSVILANFSLSPNLLTYADRAIILHPKFESVAMRKKVRDYLFSLFGKEASFYNFCTKYKADYYIYSKGTFSDSSIYSHRYAVIKRGNLAQSSAYYFEFNDFALKKFVLVYENYKYKIFKIY